MQYDMKKDLSKYHKGSCKDCQPREKAGKFTRMLVSIEWWHQKGKFAMICNFKKVDLGTRWLCEIRKSRTGRDTWYDATQIT